MSAWIFSVIFVCLLSFFLFQAEDGIRDLVRSRGLGDVYKRQLQHRGHNLMGAGRSIAVQNFNEQACILGLGFFYSCLLYTSDAADERSSVDLGGRRIIKKKKQGQSSEARIRDHENWIETNRDMHK